MICPSSQYPIRIFLMQKYRKSMLFLKESGIFFRQKTKKQRERVHL